MPPSKPRDSQFDQFEFVNEISSTNAAIVWKAVGVDEEQEYTLAYKTVPKNQRESGPHLDHIITEASVLHTLRDCSGVPTVVDHGTVPRPWIATRFLQHESLEDIFLDLTLRESVGVIKQVCETIQCAHAHDIIHGDLKPKNVITTSDNPENSVVLDWGGAKEPAGTPSDAFTVHYAAPEQLTDGSISPQTDIYQLGVFTYKLFTKIRPFRAEQESELHSAILNQEPTPIYILASEQRFKPIDQVLSTALEKDPTARYTTPKEFYTMLLDAIKSVSYEALYSQADEGDLAGVAFPEANTSTFTKLLEAAQAGYDVETVPLNEWDLLSEASRLLHESRWVCQSSECGHIQYNNTHQIMSYCDRCGTQLAEASTENETPTTVVADASDHSAVDDTTTTCPRCGSQDHGPDYRFCTNCGADLVQEEQSDTIIYDNKTQTRIALGGDVDPQFIFHLIEAGVIIIQGSKYAKSATEYVSELIEDLESSTDTPAAESHEISEEELEELLEEYVIEDDLEWQ